MSKKIFLEKIVTTRKHEILLDKNDLFEFLAKAGYKIPGNADIVVLVPGGGDWSNEEIALGSDFNHFSIKWSTEETIYNNET